MLPEEYIKSELKLFIKNFPKVRVRYEHDNSIGTHFIEIIPNEVFHLDSNYIKWESLMFDGFVSLYPDENICFISDDAFVGLENIEFELCGNEFISAYSTVNNQITVHLQNKINISSSINLDALLSANTYPNLFHSNIVETHFDCLQSIRIEEIRSNINLPLAA